MQRDPEPKLDERRARTDRRVGSDPNYDGKERRQGDRRTNER
jgi:hypothetical protein